MLLNVLEKNQYLCYTKMGDNMKIYDSHSDIFYNLAFRNDLDPFKKYHLSDLTKGNVVGGIWVVYSDSDFDVIKAYKDAIEKFKPYKDNFDVIYGLEGLRNVHTLDEFIELYNMGIRHAMLTWNEENHLATGVKGNPKRGLTEPGREFIKFMNEHDMIIDVSHLNEKSFYEVLELNPKILIASHSNAFALSDHPRNLKDEQLLALKAKGGIVGAVAARNFVSKDKSKQNCKGFAEQIRYLVNIMGIDQVMLGLDMMNYLSDFNNSNLDDLQSHGDVSNLVIALRENGFNDEEIEKITHLNYEKLKERVGK